MKIQYLIVIFILIIMPIVIVFSEYIDNQIETIKTEYEYDTRLLNSSYDAIKAYQLNTINNSLSDRPESKVDDVEAAVNTFYNSLITSFGYSGYDSSVMDEYVPAVIFCLYDGYYIYSPFQNTTTGIDTSETDTTTGDYTYDQDYKDNTTIEGVKTYIYYDCHYEDTSSTPTYDLTITYTLDNFITVDGYIGSTYYYKSGYLLDLDDYDASSISYSDVNNDNTTDQDPTNDGYAEITAFTYDGVSYSSSDPVALQEYLGDTLYYYTKIDGTKFYWNDADADNAPTSGDYIFYVDSSGNQCTQVTYKEGYEDKFMLYYNAIANNIDDFIYYRDAYNFTSWVKANLGSLDVRCGTISGEAIDTNCSTIFSSYSGIQYSNSAFNEHRQEVIRAVIETNLSTAITAYGNKYGSSGDYIMPNISETDWELIENNICIATFMQGLNIGGKIYNGYSVVANNLNKDYVDENSIYILGKDGSSGYYYYKTNDTNLSSISIGNAANTSASVRTAGVLNIDVERHSCLNSSGSTVYYFPKSYQVNKPYLGSYSSIIGSSEVNSILGLGIDMYRYVLSSNSSTYATTDNLRTAYYSGLGRERIQSYNVQHGLFDDQEATYSDGTTEDNWYYLKNYFDWSSSTSSSSSTTNPITTITDNTTGKTWIQGSWY